MASFTIRLLNLRFFAHHGLHEEEKVVGNEFEVSISLRIKAPKSRLSSIQQTINYTEVYRITKEIFSAPQHLLESLTQDIAGAIKEQYPSLRRVKIQITKLHPPIAAFIGAVSVTFVMRYD